MRISFNRNIKFRNTIFVTSRIVQYVANQIKEYQLTLFLHWLSLSYVLLTGFQLDGSDFIFIKIMIIHFNYI
ncbi:hypothetical protein SAMN06265379_101695 [Saccharicrinis carchari]|uniref:Uncharacterized protein n=1 Tax=Saccharicrinis carchari TaxID=1168039 RepID=A0A521B5F5_SACCC|nr:hypothetical protein SAMN06265379_101695 [Saccharicrinis carchari]